MANKREVTMTVTEAGVMFENLARLLKLSGEEVYRVKQNLEGLSPESTDLINYNLGLSSGYKQAYAWAVQVVSLLKLGDLDTAKVFLQEAVYSLEVGK